MLTNELLEHISTGILRDRASNFEGSDGELWPDATLLVYLNEAENMFARRTYCIFDNSTAAVCNITLANGVKEYALHKSIIKVFNVALSDSVTFLNNMAFKHLNVYQRERAAAQGRPEAWWNDTRSKFISFGPIPNATYAGLVATLGVARLPITPMIISDTSAPEIPEQYHLDLCDWVVYRCLMHQEIDGEAQNDSTKFFRAFQEAVRMGRRDTQILTEPPSKIYFAEP